jgi:hypothetical protein
MRITFSILFLLASSNLLAAEISLLARYEFSWYDPPGGFDLQPPFGIPDNEPLPFHPSIPHRFSAFTLGFSTRMEIPATPENVGKTFSLDATALARVSEGLTGAGAVFGARIGIEGPYHGYEPHSYLFSADYAFHDIYMSGFRAEAFVPQLGPVFSGYHIDALTVTIGRPMLIQIYGYAVPEPTFAVTLLTCAALVPWQRKRRNPNS